MPGAKDISELYLNHERSFLKHLKNAKNLDEKQIHKLRVEVKNLRVLFEFLKALSKEKFDPNKSTRLLKPVFKTAGKIRTAQLNQDLCKPYRKSAVIRFKKYLKKKEESAGKKFLKQVKTFDIGELKKLRDKNLEKIKKIKSSDLKEDSESFMRISFSRIRTSMFEINNDEVLHEIRKHLKTLKNMRGLMEEIGQSSDLFKELEKIDATYDKIGDWHDNVEFTATLENYLYKKETEATQRNNLAFILSLKEKTEKTKLNLIRRLKKEFV